LRWKEDSSNISLKYSRNKIRHKVIPAFLEINPRFNDVMMNNIKRLRAIEEIFLEHLEEKKLDLIIKDKNQLMIPIEKLLAVPSYSIWLYEILNEFSFSFSVVQDLIKSIEGTPGKIFFSSSHRLIKDRDYLILEAIKNESLKRYYIENPLDQIREPLSLDMEIEENSSDFKLSSDPAVAYLDLDKLEFPLIIRRWEKGDYFQPLGMANMKKISDFFIDNKLSISAKENTWLLCSGENIAWIIGLRIDDRVKITENTKRILKIMING
jgi:tRNA(Ile)-lysidine synthase